MKIRIGIANKVVLAVVSIILLMGTIAVISVFLLSESQLKRAKDDQLMAATNLEQLRFLKTFEFSENLVKSLAVSDEVGTYLAKPSSAAAEIALEHLRNSNIGNNYDNLYLLDNKGIAKVSVDPSLLNQDYSFRSYFKEAVQGKLGVEVARGVTTKKVGYYFAYPIVRGGLVMGVVVVKLKPESLNDAFADGLDTNASWMIVDEYGVILKSTKPEREFQTLGSLSNQEKSNLQMDRRYEGITLGSIGYDQTYQALKNYVSLTKLDFFDPKDNEQERMVLQKVGKYSFYVVLEENVDDIASASMSTAMIVSVLVGACVILTIVFILVLLRGLLSPINELRKMVAKVESGDYTVQADIKSGDEYQDLAITFNKMVRSVQQNRQVVEDEVKQRTAELEKLNRMMVGREIKMKELKKLAEERGLIK